MYLETYSKNLNGQKLNFSGWLLYNCSYFINVLIYKQNCVEEISSKRDRLTNLTEKKNIFVPNLAFLQQFETLFLPQKLKLRELK